MDVKIFVNFPFNGINNVSLLKANAAITVYYNPRQNIWNKME